ncbi:unnamed protein product [Peronospora belbahrii]|nr:unnamed protein product [Peronospora belbahrii]
MAVPSDDEMSTELAVAGNAAMSSLCARYAGESSKIGSKTFSGRDAVQEFQRVCLGVASDEAALASLLLSKTVEHRCLIW